jgi:hypothetical protein
MNPRVTTCVNWTNENENLKALFQSQYDSTFCALGCHERFRSATGFNYNL